MALTTEELLSLQNRREELLARGEIAALNREIPLLERWAEGMELDSSIVSRSIQEEVGRWIGSDPDFGDPDARYRYNTSTTSIDRVGDRQLGQDRLLYRSEYDLAWIRGYARKLVNEVAPAIAVQRNLVNYTIGTSWQYEMKSSDHASGPETARNVNGFLQRWLRLNQWIGKRDREAYGRTKRDGECLIKLQPVEEGLSRVRFCEPSWISEPVQSRDLDDWLPTQISVPDTPLSWTFGVVTPHDDFDTVLGYHLVRNSEGTDWDFLPERFAVHCKATTDSNVKRGVSEYYPVCELIRNGEKVFNRTASGAIVQASIAGVRQAPSGVRESQISGINRIADRTQQTEWGSRQIDQSRFGPATVLTMSSGFEWVHGPMGTQRNPVLILAGQASLRLAGARWNMPEWMISGDASNNNFSSSLVAESPFVKSAESEQHTFKCAVEELIWKAIHIAWEQGLFGRMDWEDFRNELVLSVMPTPVQRDSKALTNETTQLIHNGVMSRATAAERHDLNWEVELQRMNEDVELAQQQAADVGLGDEDM